MEISFFVSGIPQPAGSKRGFYSRKINRVIITDANPKSRDWKTSVSQHTRAERRKSLLTRAVLLETSWSFHQQTYSME